ncbi:MAG: DUF2797 domain-containing protein [Bacteroidetes bacterium]|jgi:hypothetical protein|nr:DUF2797 domain-containing protein [Bacteroidota bacterium]MBT3750367.1 DUF2797 domain-containing protein [Bacteroidota bacterium]MBT4398951.1 DUF2797 domain-containing protein [Bacteroidota bacterium]MBT4409712.1 DUF2797 domain-containing protein [Bacteroidota bacterium]MBT7091850.1 DUF2797 domain-containing protein [Bacteroidota bacterium]
MEISGNLIKLESQPDEIVQYFAKLGGEKVLLNELIGKTVSLKYLHEINCIACGAKTKSSFFQGYCFPCFSTLPETDTCIMQPETCRAHEGISRDMSWSESHCLTSHIVYLALTSTTKIGVTRESQIPTRWIDQGAWKAIKLARTPNRHTAGLIEVALKPYFTDKTSWQKMLKDIRAQDIDLVDEKDKAWELLPEELEAYCIDEDEIREINYPVDQYPEKVKSLSFDKTDIVEGKLSGIRGQYLIFENMHVFNIRRHNGYKIKLKF